MVDDVESPWLRPLNYFDYVHARHTVMAIKNWPKLMQRVYEYVPSPIPKNQFDDRSALATIEVRGGMLTGVSVVI